MGAGIFESGVPLECLGGRTKGFVTYESGVMFTLRFMVDTSVVGGNWVECPAGSYTFHGQGDAGKQSHCQLEGHVNYKELISHAPEGEWARMSPFRILSVDIECAGRKVGPRSDAVFP